MWIYVLLLLTLYIARVFSIQYMSVFDIQQMLVSNSDMTLNIYLYWIISFYFLKLLLVFNVSIMFVYVLMFPKCYYLAQLRWFSPCNTFWFILQIIFTQNDSSRIEFEISHVNLANGILALFRKSIFTMLFKYIHLVLETIVEWEKSKLHLCSKN